VKPDLVRTTRSPAQTFALGQALGQILRTGDCLALSGPLGSGKTQFVKGLAAGLGLPDDDLVTSPTFVLVRQYAGRLKLYHIDAYRLRDSAELLALGLEEMLEEPAAVVAVEWADRVVQAVPDRACWIEIEHRGPRCRRVHLSWPEAGRLAGLATH